MKFIQKATIVVFLFSISSFFAQQKQEGKPLSLSDCVIVELCMALEIDKLATYDDGFDGYLSVIDGID